MEKDRPSPVVGVLSGGSRALAAQLFSFYIRVPVKLFRPARVDYTGLLRRSVTPGLLDQPWSWWTHSNPAMLYRAISQQGWRFIPDKLLPPIVANSVVGTVLYSTYLSTLWLQEAIEGSEYPTFAQTFKSGALAGAAQSALATPLDAVAIRFDADLLRNPRTSLWTYARDLLTHIGPRAAYGGIALNVFKESASFGMFFSVFENVKGPMYRRYSEWWYRPSWLHPEGRPRSRVLYPSFVLMAGCIAALALQLVNYPLSKIQKIHTLRLQAIDQLHVGGQKSTFIHQGWQLYGSAYSKTFEAIRRQVRTQANGSWISWLYEGCGRFAFYSMPSSSIGLLVFEILRIRYAVS